MKRVLFLVLIVLVIGFRPIFANEMAEDYVDMATSYAAEGDYIQALDYVNRALRIVPQDKDIIELKSTLEGVLNPNFKSILTSLNPFLINVKSAKKQGNSSLELTILKQNADAGNHWAAYLLANKYNDMNDFSQAITYYQKVINTKPKFLQAYFGLAIAQINGGMFQQAINSLNTYLNMMPNSDGALMLKAKCLLGLRRYNEAHDTINQALSIAYNPQYELLKGKILYEKGFFLEAKSIFENLSVEYQTAEIYEYLGLCYYKQKKYADALLNFDKAIILSDDDKRLNIKYNEIRTLLQNEQRS